MIKIKYKNELSFDIISNQKDIRRFSNYDLIKMGRELKNLYPKECQNNLMVWCVNIYDVKGRTEQCGYENVMLFNKAKHRLIYMYQSRKKSKSGKSFVYTEVVRNVEREVINNENF